MKKWEYIVKVQDVAFLWSLTEMLDDMGEEGWELCSYIGDLFIFKREKKDA